MHTPKDIYKNVNSSTACKNKMLETTHKSINTKWINKWRHVPTAEYRTGNENVQTTLHAITWMTLTNITMSKRSQARRSAHSWRQLLKLEKPVRSVATLEGQVTTWKEALGAVAPRPECWLCLRPLRQNSPTHTLNLCPFITYTCALTLYFKIKFTTTARQNSTSSSCTPLRNLTSP